MSSTKPLLILIPGLMNNHLLWQHQIDNLKNIANVWVPELQTFKTIGLCAANIIKEALKQQNQPFAVAGLSMGGYVAAEIIRLAPEKVSHLALLNTSLQTDSPVQQQARRAFIQQSYNPGFKGITPRLLPHIIDKSLLGQERITSAIYQMAQQFTAKDFRIQQNAILARIDQREHAHLISCPTLVVSGENDKVTPPILQEEIHHLIPHSQWISIKNCGHLSALEQPATVTKAIKKWLES